MTDAAETIRAVEVMTREAHAQCLGTEQFANEYDRGYAHALDDVWRQIATATAEPLVCGHRSLMGPLTCTRPPRHTGAHLFVALSGARHVE